jgi:hypothetical protein
VSLAALLVGPRGFRLRKQIAVSIGGPYVLGIRRIRLEFPADTLDLGVYCFVVYVVRSVSPHFGEQARARNDIPCAAGQGKENRELQFRELNRFPSSRYSPALDIDGQVTDSNDVRGLEIRRLEPPLAPEQGVNPGAEKRRPAWHRDNGIGTREKCRLRAILSELASESEQRRAVLVGAKTLADQLPVPPANTQVQNDQVELPFECPLVTAFPVRRQFNGVAKQLELLDERRSAFRIAVYKE